MSINGYTQGRVPPSFYYGKDKVGQKAEALKGSEGNSGNFSEKIEQVAQDRIETAQQVRRAYFDGLMQAFRRKSEGLTRRNIPYLKQNERETAKEWTFYTSIAGIIILLLACITLPPVVAAILI